MAQSTQFSAYNTVAYADISKQRMSAATSLYSTLQQLMLSVGICTAAGTLTLTHILFRHATPTLHDFSIAFLVVGSISMLAVPAAACLSPQAGASMSGNKS